MKTRVWPGRPYWVQRMHVDGFRFDLASTLARELHEVEDGNSLENSWNSGAEGPTEDPAIGRVPREEEAEPSGHGPAVSGRPHDPGR